VRVHHVEQSGSAERSKCSVVLKDSPHVVGNVSAGVVVVICHDLLGNVDSSEGNEGSIRLFPFGDEVVDWVKARILLELHLPIEAIVGSSDSGSHVLSQIISGGSSGKRESDRRNVLARPQSVLDGRVGKWSLSELIRRDGIVRHLELGRNRVVGQLHSKNGSISGELDSEGGSASLSSSAKLNSGLNRGAKSGFVLRNEHGESVEDKVLHGIILKSGEQLLAWNAQDLHGNTLDISSGIVLFFLVLSRESEVNIPHFSYLKDSNSVLSWEVSTNGESAIEASSGWCVEGSSVTVWKVPLGLEFSETGIEVIVNKADITVGKRRLFSKFKKGAVLGYVSCTRETRSSIRNHLGETYSYYKQEK